MRSGRLAQPPNGHRETHVAESPDTAHGIGLEASPAAPTTTSATARAKPTKARKDAVPLYVPPFRRKQAIADTEEDTVTVTLISTLGKRSRKEPGQP